MTRPLINPDISKVSVLVVDDHPLILKMVDHLLKAMGIKNIVLAADGSIAFQHILERSKPFNIIICDWHMPVIDGLELLTRVRAQKLRSLFIMLTSNGSKEAITEALEAGVDSYIVKPIDVGDVQKRIAVLARAIIVEETIK